MNPKHTPGQDVARLSPEERCSRMENDDIIPLRCMLWPTIAVLAAVLGIAAMIYVVYQSYRQDYPLGQLSAESGSVH